MPMLELIRVLIGKKTDSVVKMVDKVIAIAVVRHKSRYSPRFFKSFRVPIPTNG